MIVNFQIKDCLFSENDRILFTIDRIFSVKIIYFQSWSYILARSFTLHDRILYHPISNVCCSYRWRPYKRTFLSMNNPGQVIINFPFRPNYKSTCMFSTPQIHLTVALPSSRLEFHCFLARVCRRSRNHTSEAYKLWYNSYRLNSEFIPRNGKIFELQKNFIAIWFGIQYYPYAEILGRLRAVCPKKSSKTWYRYRRPCIWEKSFKIELFTKNKSCSGFSMKNCWTVKFFVPRFSSTLEYRVF